MGDLAENRRKTCARDLAILGAPPAFLEPLHVGRPNTGDHAALLRRINDLLDRMLINDPVPTSSVMFRRGLFRASPDWYESVMMGDWPLHVLNLAHGDMWYDDAVLAAHRVHRGGLWSGAEPARRRLARIIDIYERLNRELGFAYDGLIRSRIARQYVALVEHHAGAGDLDQARACLGLALRASRANPRALLRRPVLAVLARLARQQLHAWRVRPAGPLP